MTEAQEINIYLAKGIQARKENMLLRKQDAINREIINNQHKQIDDWKTLYENQKQTSADLYTAYGKEKRKTNFFVTTTFVALTYILIKGF